MILASGATTRSGNLYVKITVRNRTKQRVEAVKPEDMTYDEFIAYLVNKEAGRLEYGRIRTK